MRLWHYQLVKNDLLPKTQLIAQWRELNSIFKKQDKHILINYIYEYSKKDLLVYTIIVLEELEKRNVKVKSYSNMEAYFEDSIENILKWKDELKKFKPFKLHHNDRYLQQCFYNLQEKWDRRQKDFTDREYVKLTKFMEGKI